MSEKVVSKIDIRDMTRVAKKMSKCHWWEHYDRQVWITDHNAIVGDRIDSLAVICNIVSSNDVASKVRD